VLPTIRTAADGGTVGQSGAKEETTRHIPEGSYSLGLVIGYQKDSAQEVLAGVRLGQQQRFGWCTVIDPSLPLKPPEHPGYLVSNIEDGAGLRTGTITYCQEINDELWRQNHAKVSGQMEDNDDDEDLDSHQPKFLAKTSAWLCILDGRAEVTLEDWALAKVMYNTASRRGTKGGRPP